MLYARSVVYFLNCASECVKFRTLVEPIHWVQPNSDLSNFPANQVLLDSGAPVTLLELKCSFSPRL